MCIPPDYRKACEGALARSTERRRALLECQGANRQLGEDRRRERGEWKALQAGMVKEMRAQEERAARLELERDDAKRLVVAVGAGALVVGVVVGVLVTLGLQGSLGPDASGDVPRS